MVMEVCISVNQLRDKILCNSPQMTLGSNLFSHLLERWKAGMHHIVAFLNNDILLQQLSLWTTFFQVLLRNNLRKIIASCPN
jgi:hypothetical protein